MVPSFGEYASVFTLTVAQLFAPNDRCSAEVTTYIRATATELPGFAAQRRASISRSRQHVTRTLAAAALIGEDTPMPDANVTRILEDLAAGRCESAEALLPLVYQQLHAIARRRMGEERHDHTLQATALVHEAYLKLVGDGGQVNWSGRAAFFKAAAEAMRRILIDHARTRGRVKRGGNRTERVPLSVLDLAVDSDSDQILALDEAICRLDDEDPEVASVVRLRFFAGLTVDDAAAALGISPRQADRHWSYARAWLFDRLNPEVDS